MNVVLYVDLTPTQIPQEFLNCLIEDQTAYQTFLSYTDGQKKEFIDWIYAAKTDETKVDRIAKTLNKLIRQERLRD